MGLNLTVLVINPFNCGVCPPWFGVGPYLDIEAGQHTPDSTELLRIKELSFE